MSGRERRRQPEPAQPQHLAGAAEPGTDLRPAGVMISAASSRVLISAPWAARSAAKLRRWPRSYSYRAAT